ncbi:helix-turn-helix domain-containing protein [Sulfobacillus thermosulfidooxidans]|uniref:helix-turn-helix domain-containing protein n=1 Tax=Sulfobacillus thermosulfidooxidans TaxID=28034 RepID=UPI0002DFAEF2|nr:helix-turn-helix transcriptional regulator [Sulfobacillus thermosulfidooxidans]
MSVVEDVKIRPASLTVGDRIRNLRLMQGLSVEALATPGLPVSVIELIETNQCVPPDDWIRHFAHVLGVDMSALICPPKVALRQAAQALCEAGHDAVIKGRHEDAAEILSQAYQFTRAYHWHDLLASIGPDLSQVLQLTGQVSQAADFGLHILLSLPAHVDAKDRRHTLIRTGNALYQMNHFAMAAVLYDQVISEAVGDERIVMKMLLNTGLCYLNMGQFHQAYHTFEQCWDIAKQLNEPYWLAWTHIDLAACDLMQHEAKPRTRDHLEKAEEFALAAHDQAAYAAVIHDRGEYYLYQKQWKKAETCLIDALGYLRDDSASYAFILDDLAELYIHRRYWRKAQKIIQRMLKISRFIHNERIKGLAHRRQMQWHLSRQQKDEAQEYFYRALSVFNQIGHQLEVQQTLALWSQSP